MKKLLFTILISCLAIIPLTSQAQEEHGGIDQVKLVNIPAEIKAGETINLTLKAQDKQKNTWDISEFAIFITEDPRGSIEDNVYQAGKAGSWLIEAKYGNFAAQDEIEVISGEVNSIVVNPNSMPEVINLNQSQKFEAKVFDVMGNTIENPELTFSHEGNLGEINQEGVFVPKDTGLGQIMATSSNISESVKIEVKEETLLPPVAEENVNNNTNQAAQTEEVSESEEQETEPEGEVAGVSEEAQAQEEEESPSDECTPLAWSWWLIILIIYIGVLIGYYFLVKKSKNKWWWLFPLVLTVAAFWIYFEYSCQTNGWWPWVAIIMAILVTLFRPKKFFEEPKEPTF
ncbi:MAG: hypothetical protein U5L76_01050 [Patescibacteria group bacterium]|nr:hypothetical protein [Patescibacteria group bacterium]